MSKKKSSAATEKVAALTVEQFLALSPEEQAAHLQKMADVQSENTTLKQAAAAVKPNSLPTFEVEDDEENEVEGGTYEFTAPTLHWDDNNIIDVRNLAALAASGKDKKAEAFYAEMCAKLVARKSGLVRRKED